MAVDIKTFYNIASQKQFSRDFFLRVRQIRAVGISLDGENELVFAKTASLPGRDIENKQVNYSGQTFNLNGKSSYPGAESYAIEFYADQEMDLRTKLELMSRRTFDNETTSGQMCMPGPESYMILDILKVPCGQGNEGGQGLQTVKTIKLVGVNLRTIGEIGYSIADGTGEILTIPTTFSYHWYEDFSK
jgi:hypothetical protein